MAMRLLDLSWARQTGKMSARFRGFRVVCPRVLQELLQSVSYDHHEIYIYIYILQVKYRFWWREILGKRHMPALGLLWAS